MRPTASDRPLRWAIQRHLIGTLVVLGVVVFVAVLVAGKLAAREALHHAEVDARLLASEYVLPLAADDLQAGGSTARQVLADALESRIAAGSLQRVKIWAPAGGSDGTIIFSDRADLEGRTVDMGSEHELFGTSSAMANTVSATDYGDETVDGTIEVYVGFVDQGGSSFIFEAYLPIPEMAISRAELLRDWLPVVVGSLLLLTLATLPLSVRLARRVAAAERDRRELIGAALDAALDERRVLSRRLHDGVVQDLAGVGLSLDALAARTDDPAMRSELVEVVALVRADLSELRELGAGMFVDTVGRAGLGEAIEELIRATDCGAVEVRLRIDPDVELDDATSLLAYRIVREGLRNAVRHADCSQVTIGIRADGRGTRVSVRDDGVGFDPTIDAPGHWGLTLVRTATHEAGGAFDVISTPGTGATILACLPQPPET